MFADLTSSLLLEGELKSDKEEMSSSSPFLSTTFGKLLLLTDDTSDRRRWSF